MHAKQICLLKFSTLALRVDSGFWQSQKKKKKNPTVHSWFSSQFCAVSLRVAGILQSLTVRHNHLVVMTKVRYHRVDLFPSPDPLLFEVQVICPCFHSALLPRSLYLYRSHSIFSAAIQVSSNYWVTIGTGFSIFDAAVVEIPRCQFQLSLQSAAQRPPSMT